jgi:hypothetical protein
MEFWLSKQGKEHNGTPKVPQKKMPPPSSGQIRKLPLNVFFSQEHYSQFTLLVISHFLDVSRTKSLYK